MLICYIMSGGKHAYGENSLEITVSIQANWSKVTQQNQEMNSLLSDMLVMPSIARPEFSDILMYVLVEIHWSWDFVYITINNILYAAVLTGGPTEWPYGISRLSFHVRVILFTLLVLRL